MPIRIMMWNIENFTINKRNNSDWDRNQLRWNHILGTIRLVDPDIFVLIEVEAGGAQAGQIVAGLAQQGVLQLLNDLNNPPPFPSPPPQYSVVPPIVSGTGGKREGVAVFFKHANLQFTGPYVWDGNQASPPILRTGPVAPAAYGAPWNNALPVTNNQNQMAGQYRFSRTPRAPNPRLTVTVQFPGPENRSLYLTTFLDTVANRTIWLFAIHALPQPGLARLIPRKLADLPDISNAPAPTQVKVIVGDFNLNVIDPTQFFDFGPLVGLGYTLHNANTPTSLKGVSGQSRFLQGRTYEHTGRIAAGRNDPALVQPYYDYVATARFDSGTSLGLDNILTRYGGGAGGPAANFHVVNRVFQPAPAPPNTYVPDLGLMADNVTAAAIPLILNQYQIGTANANASSANSFFRNYNRFGKIGAGRGASDHMALVIDI